METRHFIKTWCKQKVKIFFLSTLISLNPKWVPRFTEFHRTFISISKIIYVVQHLLVNASETCELKHMYQIPKRDPANICWSWKRLQHVFKTSLRRLQHVFSVTILRLPRRLEDVLKTFSRPLAWRLKDVFKTSWKAKNCYAEVVFKTSWRHVLKTSWRISWRRLQDVSEASKIFTCDICI